ncbi:hypothetical protein, partial [Pseudomonas savastanoi]|uniref:hypothetical protein n=1 Tax=Pseudomonas savastanoi TaxID=29438 RepID=UPI001F1906F7
GKHVVQIRCLAATTKIDITERIDIEGKVGIGVSGMKVVCPARWRRVCFALAFARLARLRFLVSDAMCKPVLRRDRLNFGYDNRFQNPTICSRRLPSS